jgi:hypothetical protein
VTLLIGGRLDRGLPHDDGSCLKERSRDEGWRNNYAVLRADFKVHLVILFQVEAQIQYNNGSPGTRRPEIKYNCSSRHAVHACSEISLGFLDVQRGQGAW